MPRGWLNQRRVLVILAGLLVISSLLPVSVSGAIAAAPKIVVNALLSPVTGALKTFSDTLRPGHVLEIEAGPYEQLRKDRDLALQQVHQLEIEVAYLRERLSWLTESQVEGTRTIEARVTAYSGDLVNPVLFINKGTSRGVARNLAVVWGGSLVGLVQDADPGSAEVRPITAPGTSMWVRIAPPESGAARQVSEQLYVSDDREHFYLDVEYGAPVEVGDLAALADTQGSWPPEALGRFVGKVVRIEDHPEKPLLLQRVIVRPMLDLPRLTRVVVLEPIER